MNRESDLENLKKTEQCLANNSKLVTLPSGMAKYLDFFGREKLAGKIRRDIENLSPKIGR